MDPPRTNSRPGSTPTRPTSGGAQQRDSGGAGASLPTPRGVREGGRRTHTGGAPGREVARVGRRDAWRVALRGRHGTAATLPGLRQLRRRAMRVPRRTTHATDSGQNPLTRDAGERSQDKGDALRDIRVWREAGKREWGRGGGLPGTVGSDRPTPRVWAGAGQLNPAPTPSAPPWPAAVVNLGSGPLKQQPAWRGRRH